MAGTDRSREGFHMASFDVVSQTDTQEVRNAVDQAAREIGTRFDFKDPDSTIALEGDKVEMASNTDDKLRQVIDVFESKLIKRKVSLKSFDRGEIREASGGSAKTSWTIVNGIPTDTAKRISKFVRDLKLKGIQAQIQGDQLRVTGKKIDDLQGVIAELKEQDFDCSLQFINYRS